MWKNDFIAKANPKDPENFPFFVFGNKLDKSDERKVIQLSLANDLFRFP